MNNKENEVLIKVGSGTDAIKLANSIKSVYEKNADSQVTVRAIGAGAINQAIKGVILSNSFFSQKGKLAHLLPSFKTITDEGMQKEITAVEFKIVVM